MQTFFRNASRFIEIFRVILSSSSLSCIFFIFSANFNFLLFSRFPFAAVTAKDAGSDCCVESEVSVGGGKERCCNGREASETCRHRPPVSRRDDQRPSRRLREDFMPMCDEEIFQWMQDRQADLHDATLTRNATEVSRLCHVMARCNHFEDSYSPFPLYKYRCVNVRALYGLMGVRVGEAQNPSLSHPKRRRRVSDSEVSSICLAIVSHFASKFRGDRDLWDGAHKLVWSVTVQPADVWCWLGILTQRILQCKRPTWM